MQINKNVVNFCKNKRLIPMLILDKLEYFCFGSCKTNLVSFMEKKLTNL